VGIRKLGRLKVFGGEGFGDCRTFDIGFLVEKRGKIKDPT